MQTVLVIEDFTRNLGIPQGVEQDARQGKVELWNAPRPFPCHETYHGEFLHGIFYGVINPSADYADEYRKEAQSLDAHRVEFVSKADVMAYGNAKAEEYGADPGDWDFEDIVMSYVRMRRGEDGEQ